MLDRIERAIDKPIACDPQATTPQALARAAREEPAEVEVEMTA